jgi:hypothetical protein
MARPSRWMQFTENFNAMNSTMNDAFKKYETGKASKSEDYFEDKPDAEGNQIRLTGNKLQKAKNDAMAGIYEKYGDTDGAAKMRTDSATLEGLAAQTRASNAATTASELQSANLTRDNGYNDTIKAVLADVGKQEFGSQKEEDAYLLKALGGADLPPAMRNTALASVREFGGQALAMESDRLVAGAKESMRGGLGQFTDWYNNEVADGATVEYDTTDGVTTIYAVTGEGEDQKRVEIGRGEGEGGELQAANMLFARVQDPSTVMGAAMDNLAYRKTKQDATLKDQEIKEGTINLDTLAEENGLKVDVLQAQLADLKERTKQAGISGQLNQSQMLYLAAQTAQINNNMDPDRRLSMSEIDKEWAKFTAKMVGAGLEDPAEIKGMQKMFYDSLTNEKDYLVEEVVEDK